MNDKAINHMTLTKEEWNDLIDRLTEATDLFGQMLRRINNDGMGEQDEKEWKTDMLLAITAVSYVANFAADKCVFVGVPDQ